MKLSIIIPLYNEQNTIISVLDGLYSLDFSKFFDSFEIIVIDDGSKDLSFSKVLEYSQKYNNIIILKNIKNKGKGYSIREGIKAASGDILLFQDADLELSINDIPNLLNAFFSLNVDFVNGSRYLPGIPRPLSSFYRYLGNKIFTFLVSIILNVKITDVACGYKLIRKSLIEKFDLKEERFGIEVELMIKALKINKFKIAEVPVQYFQRTVKEGKKLTNFDALKILLKIFKYAFVSKNFKKT